MYAQIGNIKFEGLIGFDSLDHSSSANFAEHAVIKGKPRLQKVGTNLDEVKVSMTFHSMFCSPENQIAALIDAMENGEVLPFVTGSGELVGDFVIVDVNRKPDQTDAQGRIIVASVEVTMREFYDPALVKRREEEAKAAGFANSENNPVISIAPTDPQSLTAAASANINGALTETKNLSAAINAVSDDPTDESSFRRAERSLKAIRQQTQSAISKVNLLTGQMYTQTRDLVDDLTEMQNLVDSLDTAVGARDAVLAVTGFNQLETSVNNVNNTNAVLTGFVATRR